MNIEASEVGLTEDFYQPIVDLNEIALRAIEHEEAERAPSTAQARIAQEAIMKAFEQLPGRPYKFIKNSGN